MSSDESSKDLLLSKIANLHESGAYSDFKIVCGSEVFNVHKAIICPQSDFFRAACRPDTFREGKTGIVTLPLSVMRDVETLVYPITAETFDWDMDVENITTIKLMIHYFYHHDYPSKKPSDDTHDVSESANWKEGCLGEHARMYAMGDKYGIPGLKILALRKFKTSLESALSITYFEFATVIAITHLSTPSTDRGLRKEIADFLHAHKPVAKTDMMVHTVKDFPDLVYALYCKLLQDPVDNE
ncbi:hypothetical protein E4T50_01664 [Aureobasidium sp. EXF-12298]|nr:hypothetical protein E4T50_01664 [Aureobasidium sp. EXF-12298]KAI4764546.1 hypothetical protein E4T51_02450 [Aureobasidium sp. EXF-12344]KAI4782233.1 hypothetical protein E4T52_02892 [Aureobasidium sp. EXF-3400]